MKTITDENYVKRKKSRIKMVKILKRDTAAFDVFYFRRMAHTVKRNTTKGGSRRLEKSHNVSMMMMIAASLMWAGAAEKPD